MESFLHGPLYSCKFCAFMASDQWHCDLHRKLCHEKLFTEKTKMLITTLLNTIVHPHSTRNIQILINDKNEYLTSIEKSPPKKPPLIPKSNKIKKVIKENIDSIMKTKTGQELRFTNGYKQSQETNLIYDDVATTQDIEREEFQLEKLKEESVILHEVNEYQVIAPKKIQLEVHQSISEVEENGNQIYETETTINLGTPKMNIILPNENEIKHFRYISMWERLSWKPEDFASNLSKKNVLDNLPQNKVESVLSIYIKNKLERHEMICRNKCKDTVEHMNVKFDWCPEWFERFCHRYEFTNESHNLKQEENYNLLKHAVRNYDLIDKPRFPAKRKKLCLWKCEKFSPNGKRIREEMLNLHGTRRGNQNCPSHVNRPCSNRTCTKTACATYHSFGLCEICAANMPSICENIEYGRYTSLKRGKCKGTYGKCSNETKIKCANSACDKITCRKHTRLLCLACILLPRTTDYIPATTLENNAGRAFSAVVQNVDALNDIEEIELENPPDSKKLCIE